MNTRYIQFIKNLKLAICDRPELLDDHPYLDVLFENTLYPLLPNLMRPDVRARHTPSYSFDQLNLRFIEYRNLAASLQFILDSYLAYKELACLEAQDQESQLQGYAQDLVGVENQLNQILAASEACRKSPQACRLLTHYYLPQTVPPASLPVVSGALFCQPLSLLKTTGSESSLTPEWVQYN